MSELPHGGSLDDMDIVERQLRMAHGYMMGKFVMMNVSGEVVSTAPITMDHETVGRALNNDASSTVAEEMLYKNLDDEQQRIYDELAAAGILPERKP